MSIFSICLKCKSTYIIILDEILEEETNKIDVVVEVYLSENTFHSLIVYICFKVCGVSNVINDGFRMLKPGGLYLFIGMVHPNSQLNITGEQIIRKCMTIKGREIKYFKNKRKFSLGIHNYAPRHLDQAVQFLAKTIHKYPYEGLMGPTYNLSDLSSAMQVAIGKQYSRILVQPNI